MCSREEQYKRFVMGVGLPTLRDLYSQAARSKPDPEFYAWPRGWEVPVGRIHDIHVRAFSRSFIEDYTKFRSALATVASQLAPMPGLAKPKRGDAWDNVLRLPAQIKVLKGLKATQTG
jgi:hypothetical protein